MKMLSIWISNTLLILMTTGIFPGISGSTTLYLSREDCSKLHALPSDHSKILVTALPADLDLFPGDVCNVTFYSEDRSADIVISFGDDDVGHSYISGDGVLIDFYSNHSPTSTSPSLVERFTHGGKSDMNNDDPDTLRTDSVSLVISGGDNRWALYFSIKAVDGPISGYPMSIVCGVIALSMGATVLVTLVIVWCCCCCCCGRGNSQEISVRRRRRIINHLRKEGYSVTRDYGATSESTPILSAETTEGHTSLLRGATNYDPPPSYDSVRSLNLPGPAQRGRQSPSVSYHCNPQPAAVIERERPRTASSQQRQPVVPEAVLVVIETEPPGSSADDLMHFSTPPEHAAPRSPVDLLCESTDLGHIPPPAFGAATVAQ